MATTAPPTSRLADGAERVQAVEQAGVGEHRRLDPLALLGLELAVEVGRQESFVVNVHGGSVG